MPHSEYIQKLRKGVKGSPAVAAFNLHANARRATDEAHQLMAAGGIVTSVDDAAELEKVEYWQQGDASLATKEKMEARQALRHHKVVLEALQMYWEAAQRSLHSGGDPSANELHQEGHALMLRRIYRVMIKDFDPDECERSIAEDWARDTKGKETLSRKLFCDAFFELADTWTAGIDAHEYAAFLKVLFGTVTVKKPVVGADGQLIMVSFVWKDEVDCVFDEAYAEEVEEIIEQEQPAVVASAGKSAAAPAVTTKPPRDAKQSATPPRDAKAGTTDVPDPEPQPISTPKKRKDYRARAKDGIKKKGEDTSKKSQAAKVIQSKHRQRKAVKEKETRKQAVATIHKQAAKKVAKIKQKPVTGPNLPLAGEDRRRVTRRREWKLVNRSVVAGTRGVIQYWALRKGIPPRLQEAFDELCEEDQETVASLSEEKRIKFLRRGITDKGIPPHVIEVRRSLNSLLRAAFNDLTRSDQIVISEMLPEKRWAFLQRRPDAIERASRPLHERMLERSLVWVQAEDGTTRHLRLRHAIGVGFRRAIEERGANWLNFTVGWEGGTQARKVKPSDPLTAGAFFYPAAAVKRTETELAGAFFYPAATRLEGSRYGLLFHEPAPPQLPKGERSSSRLAGPAKGPYTGLSDSHLDAQIAALEYNRALDSLTYQEQRRLDGLNVEKNRRRSFEDLSNKIAALERKRACYGMSAHDQKDLDGLNFERNRRRNERDLKRDLEDGPPPPLSFIAFSCVNFGLAAAGVPIITQVVRRPLFLGSSTTTPYVDDAADDNKVHAVPVRPLTALPPATSLRTTHPATTMNVTLSARTRESRFGGANLGARYDAGYGMLSHGAAPSYGGLHSAMGAQMGVELGGSEGRRERDRAPSRADAGGAPAYAPAYPVLTPYGGPDSISGDSDTRHAALSARPRPREPLGETSGGRYFRNTEYVGLSRPASSSTPKKPMYPALNVPRLSEVPTVARLGYWIPTADVH